MLLNFFFIIFHMSNSQVHAIIGNTELDLDSLMIALKFAGEDDVNKNSLAWILSNLIHEGRIKGYISDKHSKLVVSKTNPFPALNL